MNEQLQQQLMEFVYGLLDEGEADAMSERITSDPQVARAYATVKLQCDLVARAARYDAPTVAWSRLAERTSASDDVQPASKAWSANASRRLANWCIGVAASGLICMVGSTYWMSSGTSRSESTTVAFARATPAHVVVTGPSKLNAEASSPFTIQVENQAGTPVSTTLNYRVYDVNGALSWHASTSTDDWGVARFDVESTVARDASRLEITSADDSPAPILRKLEAASERFVTYLRMDRPLYQPGESVLYRSVTLSRFGLRADREVTTSFEIVNASDEPIEGSTKIVGTEYGVASGEFVLPSDLPDGTYSLIARSPDNLFREEWRDFQVRRYAAPRLLKKLELAQDSYSLGDQVDVDFSAKRVAGEPLAESPLKIQATVDGVPLAAPQAKTDADGYSRFSLSLPESIARGEASVSVTVQAGDEPAETITKEIPINLGKVNVDFYPEGGDLGGGLPSRVYFYGRDPLGKPTHIEGRIVDSGDKEITEVVTGHEGRGVFSLTPIFNEQYRLIIEKPAGVTKEVPLPVTSPLCFTTIETGEGVFDANAPIAFTLHKVYPVEPLIVAAYCRGAMVGQQTLDYDGYSTEKAAFATFRGELTLPPQAQGVIRLTVFDAAHTPPTPIAERLVYRRVGQKLDVRLTPDAKTFAPGQLVRLDLAVRDENDAPVPAVLGISIVDEAVLNLADDKSMRMPTYFQLLTEIDSHDQLEDANFYLSDGPDSVAALDSLLGTQGWRRFREVPATQLAQAAGGPARFGGGGGGGFGDSFRNQGLSSRYREAAWAEETAVPISTASTIDVHESGHRQSTQFSQAAASTRTSWALPIIIASLVLVGLVGIASLRPVQSNRPLRAVAVVVAVVSLVVGVQSLPTNPILVDLARDNATPQASREVAMLSDEPMAEGAVEEADATPFPSEAIAPESFMYKSDGAAKLSAAPSPDEPSESGRVGKLQLKPQGAARVALPQEPLDREAALGASEKPADSALGEDKKEALPLPAARPSSEAAAKPSAPPPTVDSFQQRRMLSDDQSKSLGAKNFKRQFSREYADWFFLAQSSTPSTDQSSASIVWQPLYIVDETAKATLYFKLPQRASSFRAIVEAHGADRLGAGELLINSR